MIVSRSILAHCLLVNVALSLPAGENDRKNSEGLELTVVHFNDFHARFEEQSPSSGVCKPEHECHGGFARLYETVTRLMNASTNPILLNAGDNFQGTLWYTLFRWNVTQYFMNMLPLTAHTLGNHEFDDGVAGLAPFLAAMRAPALVCNLNDTAVPAIQGLHRKSITVDVAGRRIGIVGVASATTPSISNVGELRFLDEAASVNAEVDRLVRDERVHAAVVLSHAGYAADVRMARASTARVALIVGGHSHTFLNDAVGDDGTPPAGPYPTVVRRARDGRGVPVVQASAYTRYVGNLKLVVGADGEAASWSGRPIFLSSRLPQNEKILDLMRPFRAAVAAKGATVFGSTEVYLEADTCRFEECNLGDFITDLMVEYYKTKAVGDSWTYSSLAIMNSGGIRSSIPIGNITYNDVATSQPFGNTFDVGYLEGTHIKAFLERTAMPTAFKDLQANVQLLQLSGFRVVYDLSRPANQRVVDVQLLCADCPAPVYEPLEPLRRYRLIVPSFIADGGDGYAMIADNYANRTEGPTDMDVFAAFVARVSPVRTQTDGRMRFVGGVRPRREAAPN